MLSKYEPVVLALLALGAAVLLENHHRIDMTARADEAAGFRGAVIATCRPAPRGPRLSVTSALAAEGQATLLATGDRDDVEDACAATHRSYSAAASDADSVVP